MICHYISQYLKSHKRLTVPHLGTFLFNADSNEILFFDLLKNDDGVLRQLLVNDGYTQIDAAGAIDRFVFEVRHRVESGGTYTLEGIGLMSRGFDGLYSFKYDQNAGRKIAVPAEDAAKNTPQHTADKTAETTKEPQNAGREPADNSLVTAVPTTDSSSDTAEIRDAADSRGADPARKEQEDTHDKTAHTARQMGTPSQPQNISGTEYASGIHNEDTTHRTADATSNTERKQPETPRTANNTIGKQRSIIEPESYVKGLRYGKPARSSKDDLRYVGHNQRRHVDKFIIIAIVAAILAVAAILYGYFNNRAISDEWIYDDPVETVQPELSLPTQIQNDAE